MRYFFIFFSYFLCPTLSATHIVGGEMRYECLSFGPNFNSVNIKIELKVYRDCHNGIPNFDNPAYIGIYEGQNTLSKVLKLSPKSDDTLALTLPDPCLMEPEGICVHVARYDTVINLPISQEGYYFVYGRCCRNGTINNIPEPLLAGATYYVFASRYAMETLNKCPQWKDYPPVTVCLGKPIDQDHSALDAESDTRVYHFTSPLLGASQIDPQPNTPAGPPFLPVALDTNYTVNALMGGNPVISIDSITGRITGTPDRHGNFVIGVLGREYRGNTLLSEFMRDFQYTVSSCAQSRMIVETAGATCDNLFQQIDITVENGKAPYKYLWSTGETTQDLPTAIPDAVYTLTITDADDCQSVLFFQGNDCVWPGDANYDGKANMDDILAIGLFSGDQGPVRKNASSEWVPQAAPVWNARQGNGINVKHIDCDGSGAVNNFDVAAVDANYDKDHPTAFKGEQYKSGPKLLLTFDSAFYAPGSLAIGRISLGSVDQRAENAYGISFTVRCDRPELIADQWEINDHFYPTVFGKIPFFVSLYKGFPQEGRFDFAVSNSTRKSFKTLYGPVAFFGIVVGQNSGEKANFTFENVRLIDDKGNTLPVQTESAGITVNTREANVRLGNLGIYPNPANDKIQVESAQPFSGEKVQLEIIDNCGATVWRGAIADFATKQPLQIDLPGLPSGMYWLKLTDSRATYSGKWVKQ